MRSFRLALALSFLALPLMAETPRRTPLPNWGTADPIAYVIGAWEFQPNLGTEAPLARMGGVQRGGGTPGAFYAAHAHLPSGARVVGLEITGCDNSATTEIEGSLYEVLPNGSVDHSVVASSGVAATGCDYYSAGAPNFNVSNLNFTYVVFITLGDPVGNTFSNVRVYYVLDVSPAPATASFTDVPTNHLFFQYIEALKAAGITAGCTQTTYCPNDPVTRGQMAVFLSRLVGLHWPF